MSNNAVSKGLEFEEATLTLLKKCGLNAWRTNQKNPYDPEQYKAGFDGGVDIIATFESGEPHNRNFTFFIQCKCHKTDITKSAISEVYAGMHARKESGVNSIAVVFATGDASQETRQFAMSLGVELFLEKEFRIIENVGKGMPISYKEYGTFFKTLLYHYTKDPVWVQTMPYCSRITADENQIQSALFTIGTEYDSANSHLEHATILARKAYEEQQKSIAIQKVAAINFAREVARYENRAKNSKKVKKEKPTIDMDSG